MQATTAVANTMPVAILQKKVPGTPGEAEQNVTRAIELTSPFSRSYRGRAAKMLLLALALNQLDGRHLDVDRLRQQTLLSLSDLQTAAEILVSTGLISVKDDSVFLTIP
jgi:hypothetical protein